MDAVGLCLDVHHLPMRDALMARHVGILLAEFRWDGYLFRFLTIAKVMPVITITCKHRLLVMR